MESNVKFRKTLVVGDFFVNPVAVKSNSASPDSTDSFTVVYEGKNKTQAGLLPIRLFQDSPILCQLRNVF